MLKKISEMNEPELRYFLSGLGREIEDRLPPGPSAKVKCLFVLLVADTVVPGIAQYLSNARREDCIQFLKETADRLEKKEDIPR